MRHLDWHEAASRRYDTLIVGSGFAGAIMAKQLARAGHNVLLLEAGAGEPGSFEQHLGYVANFQQATAKTPNSPYPDSPNAPQPEVTDVARIPPGGVSAKGYFVQQGPYPFESNYTRRLGGTSLHWFGSCPRMLPEDFAMASRFGRGVDWPWTYEELLPFYSQAEAEIGVSADVAEQQFHGIHFPPGYQYPMHKVPQSFLDQWLMAGLDTLRLPPDGRAVQIRSIPQARNSVPNPEHADGAGYRPRGAVGDPAIGQRCMGNSSCIPICPIQARYNSLKTLQETQVDVLTRAVVSRLHIDKATGRITGLDCKVWHSDGSQDHQLVRLEADLYVLAANAIENAVLLLASNACGGSGMLGRNLMDHPAMLSWGLAPQSIGAFRGPGLTSTLVNYRGGSFRAERAGFVLEIGNWGWSWPKNEPVDSTTQFVDERGLFGTELRQQLGHTVPKQIRFDMMTEQLPNAGNRVSISDHWRDAMGNFRPVINYDVDDYSRAGLVAGRQLARELFEHLGIQDFTRFSPDDPGYFQWQNQGYSWSGVGHVAGTHRMGKSAKDSVVDRYQRAWDHPNLFVIGCGSMPTLGTSNPTLTMTALTFATAKHIIERNQ
ncbi:GMC family oxidoreductase [Shewanella cyperi]|uniref:GMC family oxidoreductase n=1 Tax=Shewanella cyperi TaxID=2814292 RepID=A0A975AJL0_9GAMM|nr:GMC family oxidoreductase [Shewanella cyperi]QSX29397.1 GMC family oxidoreductase [Shewanella cyperi]